jgi:PHD/YefM family antitoxin component YafN of YafNO toxin-antitoxin module
MNLSTRVRYLSDFKANAAAILLDLEKQDEPLVKTQNGQAKTILQALGAYEKTQESLALLEILALGSRQVEAGKTMSWAGVAARVEAKRSAA